MVVSSPPNGRHSIWVKALIRLAMANPANTQGIAIGIHISIGFNIS